MSCNCAEYPHVLTICGSRLELHLDVGGVVSTGILEVGESETIQANGHFYLVKRVEKPRHAAAS